VAGNVRGKPIFWEKTRMRSLVIYVHGKGGAYEEVEHYKPLFADSDVIGFDYKSQNPWEAKEEFSQFFDEQSKDYDSVILIANSIGAFLSLSSLADKHIDRAYLISPIVDMEKLITDMMIWANISEKQLAEQLEIDTDFGETLSWDYFCYVRNNPIKWNIPTHILYGENDNLTSIETISIFSQRIGAELTILKGGEHWFHTDEQMKFLDDWLGKTIK
jgi:pimeloyl-ACP methyl ester carboxylesterase